MRPAEGWIPLNARSRVVDPLGLARTYHDVAADDGQTQAAIHAAIGAGILSALRAEGLSDDPATLEAIPLCKRFEVPDPAGVHGPLQVSVVNVVHSTQCIHGDGSTQLFFFRRLLDLGLLENKVNASIKISYRPPLNSCHICFGSGRVLETGANNEPIARALFYSGTLDYLRAAGLRMVVAERRDLQNIVATCVLPPDCVLDLPTLQWREGDHVYWHGSSASRMLEA